MPKVQDIIRDFRRLLNEYEVCMAVGEVYLEDIQDWASYYGKQLDELHLPFNFRLILTPWNAAAVRRSVDELEAVLPPPGTLSLCLVKGGAERVAILKNSRTSLTGRSFEGIIE